MNQEPHVTKVLTTLEDLIKKLQDQRLDDRNIVETIILLGDAGRLRRLQETPASHSR